MNPVEIGLSFLEGLALIASPCILPVLPLVLSASVEGGRKRPFGIILGFVIAFTAFAMLSRALVTALHVNLDYIKYGSLVLLGAFGLVLLSEKLSAKFDALTQRFASAGNNLTQNAKEGFGSGILIGMLIGLVWTPCAGPILAAVLVQVIRQENNLTAFLLVAAFAFGAGAPMLVIALTGRKVMGKLGFFTKHAEGIRKTFGVIILLAVAFIASGADINALFARQDKAVSLSGETLTNPLAKPYPAPEFQGIDGWLNSDPLTMASLKGKVVLIDFWTYSCINCIRTLPYITEWDRKYRDKGLVIVGVHSPEFEFEKNKANVAAALVKYGIHYPVALDSKLDTWSAFKNQYWPAHYLIDKNGQVVYVHSGEGHYDVTENNIRFLLGLNKTASVAAAAPVASSDQTPETYLGRNRAARFGGPESVMADTQTYSFPQNLAVDHWALQGPWKIGGEQITATAAGATLRLNFTAAKVFLVLGTQNGASVKAELTLNGKPLGQSAGADAPHGRLTVKEHRLYEMVSQGADKAGLLEIRVESPGLQAYAFTFGE